VKAVLGESDGAIACRVYGVTEHGTTVLSRAVELDALEEAHLEGLRDKLLAERARRAVQAETRTSSRAGTPS
jgi:hypothetical protein